MMQQRSHEKDSSGDGYGGPRELPAGYVLKDEYVIERTLGAGGFGITYLARHRTLRGKKVAIKEYLPRDHAVRDSDSSVNPASLKDKEMFDWGRERFVEEANNIYRVSNPHRRHPNIVAIETIIPANNTAYMVMELVEGETLADLLEDETETFDEKRLRGIIAQLLTAIETIHAENLIHRDIKPGNIVLRSDGSPVLIDFGSARAQVRELDAKTKGGDTGTALTAIVTPGYSPLEQEEATTQDARTDIYALAATIYRAAFGRKPAAPMMRQGFVREGKADPLSAAKSLGEGRFSASFLDAIDRGLGLYREDRPKSVAEWRKLFGIEQETIEPGIRPTESKAKSGRRSAGPLIASLGALVLAAALAIYWYMQETAYQRAMDRANTALLEDPAAKRQVDLAQAEFSEARSHKPQDELAAAGSKACDELLRFLALLRNGEIDRAADVLETALASLRVAQVDEAVVPRLQATLNTAKAIRNARNLIQQSTLVDGGLESAAAWVEKAKTLSSGNSEVLAYEQAIGLLQVAADRLRGNNFNGAELALTEAEEQLRTVLESVRLEAAHSAVAEQRNQWIFNELEQATRMLVRNPVEPANLAEVRSAYQQVLRVSPQDAVALAGVDLVEALLALTGSATDVSSASERIAELRQLTVAAGVSASDTEVVIAAVSLFGLDRDASLRVREMEREPLSAQSRNQARIALEAFLEAARGLQPPEAQLEKHLNQLGVINLLDRIENLADEQRFSEARTTAEELPNMLVAAGLASSVAEEVGKELTAREQSKVGRSLTEAEQSLISEFPAGIARASELYESVLALAPGNDRAKQGTDLVNRLSETRTCGLAWNLDCAWKSLADARALVAESEIPAAATSPTESWLRTRTADRVHRELARSLDDLKSQQFSASAYQAIQQRVGEIAAIARLSDEQELEATTAAVMNAANYLQGAEAALTAGDFKAATEQASQARAALESHPRLPTAIVNAFAARMDSEKQAYVSVLVEETERDIDAAVAGLTNEPFAPKSMARAKATYDSLPERRVKLAGFDADTSRIQGFMLLFEMLEVSEQFLDRNEFAAAAEALSDSRFESPVPADVADALSAARAEMQRRQSATVEDLVTRARDALREAPLDPERQQAAQNAFRAVLAIDPERTELADQGLALVAILAEAGKVVGDAAAVDSIVQARRILGPARSDAPTRFVAFKAAQDVLDLAILELDVILEQLFAESQAEAMETLASETLDIPTLDRAREAFRKIRQIERALGDTHQVIGALGLNAVRRLKRARLGIDTLHFSGAEATLAAAGRQVRSLPSDSRVFRILADAITRLNSELNDKKPNPREYRRILSEAARLAIENPLDTAALADAAAKISHVLENLQADLPEALALSAAVVELQTAAQAKGECRVEAALDALSGAQKRFGEAWPPTTFEEAESEILKACPNPQ